MLHQRIHDLFARAAILTCAAILLCCSQRSSAKDLPNSVVLLADDLGYGDVGRDDDEGPQHEVELTKGFYLGVNPVTQDEYQQIIDSNPSNFTGDPRRPVEKVSWFDAVAFCNRLSEREHRSPFYSIQPEAETLFKELLIDRLALSERRARAEFGEVVAAVTGRRIMRDHRVVIEVDRVPRRAAMVAGRAAFAAVVVQRRRRVGRGVARRLRQRAAATSEPASRTARRRRNSRPRCDETSGRRSFPGSSRRDCR